MYLSNVSTSHTTFWHKSGQLHFIPYRSVIQLSYQWLSHFNETISAPLIARFISGMVDLYHFVGWIFTDVCTHAHHALYNWADFLVLIFAVRWSPMKLKLRKLYPSKISHYTVIQTEHPVAGPFNVPGITFWSVRTETLSYLRVELKWAKVTVFIYISIVGLTLMSGASVSFNTARRSPIAL